MPSQALSYFDANWVVYRMRRRRGVKVMCWVTPQPRLSARMWPIYILYIYYVYVVNHSECMLQMYTKQGTSYRVWLWTSDDWLSCFVTVEEPIPTYLSTYKAYESCSTGIIHLEHWPTIGSVFFVCTFAPNAGKLN